jgi:pantoate--beta-alanine ligase
MQVIETVREMADWSAAERAAGRRICLVPTMGFLHAGHLSLVRRGRELAERLVVSIFVNPAQFGPNEDFASYPRDFARDRNLLEKAGVDALFHPTVQEMYPFGYQTYVCVEALSRHLCGNFRPNHFRGVATVVTKLFAIVRPHLAVFGEKDYQQLQIVRRLSLDLNLGVEIVSHPTVRDEDGLALSSRNAYLDPLERKAALSLFRGLRKAESLAREGVRDAKRLCAAARAEIEKEPLARIEYLTLCDPESLTEVERLEGTAILCVAARIGRARLIDNLRLSES